MEAILILIVGILLIYAACVTIYEDYKDYGRIYIPLYTIIIGITGISTIIAVICKIL